MIDSCINNNNVSQKHSPASSTHSSLLHITTAKYHDYHIPETIHVDENSIHIQSSTQQKHDCSINSYNNKKNTKEFQLLKTIACPTPPAQENIQSLDDGDDKKLVPSQLNSNFYMKSPSNLTKNEYETMTTTYETKYFYNIDDNPNEFIYNDDAQKSSQNRLNFNYSENFSSKENLITSKLNSTPVDTNNRVEVLFNTDNVNTPQKHNEINADNPDNIQLNDINNCYQALQEINNESKITNKNDNNYEVIKENRKTSVEAINAKKPPLSLSSSSSSTLFLETKLPSLIKKPQSPLIKQLNNEKKLLNNSNASLSVPPPLAPIPPAPPPLPVNLLNVNNYSSNFSSNSSSSYNKKPNNNENTNSLKRINWEKIDNKNLSGTLWEKVSYLIICLR